MVSHSLMIVDGQKALMTFSNLFTRIIDLNAPIRPGVTEQLSYVSFSSLMKLRTSLDSKKAIGHDKLPTIVLKECVDSLAPSITAIINFSLNKGFQLSDWKKANLPPIFKKREKRVCRKLSPRVATSCDL